MLTFSEIFEFSRENSYFERIRMVRMVRSLADRTFQPRPGPLAAHDRAGAGQRGAHAARRRRHRGRRAGVAARLRVPPRPHAQPAAHGLH